MVEFGIFREKEALQELLHLVNYDFFPIAFDEMPFTFWSNREYMTDKLSLVEASTTVPNKILCIAWSYTMEHVDNPTAVETLLGQWGIPFSKNKFSDFNKCEKIKAPDYLWCQIHATLKVTNIFNLNI